MLAPVSRADQILTYSDELAKRFRPQKIVLFGSHASRQATKESDVDMLVVMPHKGPAAIQAARIRQQVRHVADGGKSSIVLRRRHLENMTAQAAPNFLGQGHFKVTGISAR